jgi:chromosome segregation ATPase
MTSESKGGSERDLDDTFASDEPPHRDDGFGSGSAVGPGVFGSGASGSVLRDGLRSGEAQAQADELQAAHGARAAAERQLRECRHELEGRLKEAEAGRKEAEARFKTAGAQGKELEGRLQHADEHSRQMMKEIAVLRERDTERVVMQGQLRRAREECAALQEQLPQAGRQQAPAEVPVV